MAVNGRCSPVLFHILMNESFEAEMRFPAHTHTEGCSEVLAARVASMMLTRTVDDAYAHDAAVMPRENALALPRPQPPHTNAAVVRAGDEPIAVASERED